jgi:hypothetical protein
VCNLNHLSTTSGAAHILVFVVLRRHVPLKLRSKITPTVCNNPERCRALPSRIVGQNRQHSIPINCQLLYNFTE